jgi:hypothetical protein
MRIKLYVRFRVCLEDLLTVGWAGPRSPAFEGLACVDRGDVVGGGRRTTRVFWQKLREALLGGRIRGSIATIDLSKTSS